MFLIRCSLPLLQCRGRGYDSASNNDGTYDWSCNSGWKTAIQVHCFAHSLNLCLQDAAKICKCGRDCFSLVMEIIRYSPKRSLVFNNIKAEIFLLIHMV